MKRYSVCVILAGVLWGLMGLFVHLLADIGIGSTGAVLLRCSVAALCFAVLIVFKDRDLFKIKPRDFWCFFGAGVCALLFFSYCYFRSMEYIDLSTAAILLYTAPPMVIIMSAIIFREKFTVSKVIAVLLAFAGCCLVSGVGSGQRISAAGLLLGLGAGFGYALYSIFAKLAIDRGYDSMTVNFYACLLAALGGILLWEPAESFSLMFDGWQNLLLCVAAGCVTCFLPYLLYTSGLSGLETGRASIMASVEPVVATLVGVFLFGQPLSLMGGMGIVLILAAIVMLNVKAGKNR